MSRKERIVIFGAGPHAKVVLDVLKRLKRYAVVGILDDSNSLKGAMRWGGKVMGGRDQFALLQAKRIRRMFVAVGDNRQRQAVSEEAVKAGFEFVSVVHPSAVVGGGVTIGRGTLLAAGAVVNVDTVVGESVIVNTGATVDHDCRIGAYVHLSPGVHLAGNVTVGELAHLGIGAVVLPNLTIGRACVVGAGSVVLENVPDGAVVAGNPARPIQGRERSHGG